MIEVRVRNFDGNCVGSVGRMKSDEVDLLVALMEKTNVLIEDTDADTPDWIETQFVVYEGEAFFEIIPRWNSDAD